MKKVLIFTVIAILLLSLLTGCRELSNVSDAADGSVTSGSAGSAMEGLSEMITDIVGAVSEEVETITEPSPESRYSRRDVLRGLPS